jgi:hypothetical protein
LILEGQLKIHTAGGQRFVCQLEINPLALFLNPACVVLEDRVQFGALYGEFHRNYISHKLSDKLQQFYFDGRHHNVLRVYQ